LLQPRIAGRPADVGIVSKKSIDPGLQKQPYLPGQVAGGAL
jgi:hypothetical protein